MATLVWRDVTGEPLPRVEPGEPAAQIERFEFQVVDAVWERATPDNARKFAERLWDMVEDRNDEDPVKKRVVECHEALAKLTHSLD